MLISFKKLGLVLFAGLIFISCKPKERVSPSQYYFAIAQSKTAVQKMMEVGKIPGVAVAVAVKGQVIWKEGFGYADLEQMKLVNPDSSQFRIGSVSKPLTTVGLGQIYENGQISLDTNIRVYLPNFPEKKWPITVRQLSGHLAGIRHYKGLEFLNNTYYPTVSSGLTIFQDDPLLHEPGSKYAYSSYGFNLLSAVMESVSGMPFLDYMQKNVFQKVSMSMTQADKAKLYIPWRTAFYQLNLAGEIEKAPDVDNSYKWAGGGFISTATDLVKFSNGLFRNELISSGTKGVLYKGQQTSDGRPTNYGIGFRIMNLDDGQEWVGHSGGSVGGTCFFMMHEEEQIVVVLLTNLSSAKLANTPQKIAKNFYQASRIHANDK